MAGIRSRKIQREAYAWRRNLAHVRIGRRGALRAHSRDTDANYQPYCQRACAHVDNYAKTGSASDSEDPFG